LNKKLKEIGMEASESLSRYAGTWSFVIIYTLLIVSWIFLHKNDYVNIDSNDLTFLNILLAYMSGIQASIVLMADKKCSYEERKRHDYALEKEEEGLRILASLSEKISEIESLVQELEDEDNEEERKRTTSN
jgi:uncharacterized membrane protein